MYFTAVCPGLCCCGHSLVGPVGAAAGLTWCVDFPLQWLFVVGAWALECSGFQELAAGVVAHHENLLDKGIEPVSSGLAGDS